MRAPPSSPTSLTDYVVAVAIRRSLEDGESVEGAVRGDDLDVDTVGDDLALLLELMELVLGVLGEAELDG